MAISRIRFHFASLSSSPKRNVLLDDEEVSSSSRFGNSPNLILLYELNGTWSS
ncbi:hypothetical protein LSH36_24g09026 [Paralvinella palmiformis]|uniref:Uncharacterized protein n=1 Tax=Paralvinella palmiformis TaxID=53620 RepID=A0AAD9NGJ2_9ANNE|nr:hypothetical protein LSH36_24g09026 [Paralvinella palmiformis]